MLHSIKFRILSRLGVIVSAVLLVLSISMLFIVQQILQFSLESRSKDDLQLLTYMVDDMQSDASQTSKLLSINENVQHLLIRQQSDSVSNEVLSVHSIMSNIEKSALLQDYVQSFCIVTSDHTGYWNSSPSSNDFLEWFEETVLLGESVTNFSGFTSCYDFPITVNSSQPVQLVSYVCPLNTIEKNRNTTIGNLIINLNFDQLVYKLKNQSTLFSQIAILDENHELMYLSSGDPEQLIRNISSMNGDTGKIGKSYYCKRYMKSTGWYLVTSVDMDKAYHYMNPAYITLGLLIMFAVVFCIMVFLYPLLNTITKQIQDLSLAIDQVRQGKLDTNITLTGSRELRNISDGFNQMTVSIQEHIKKSIEENQRSQQLSFELLLAKINPHFIYNTLNSIIYLARKKKCEDIIQMTSSFIYLLQDSIHLGHSPLFARFENEAEVIRQYIIIQQYRYRNRFLFELHLDEELQGYYLPRNILQPLVENSLIHGICTDDKQGTILLTMKKEADHSVIFLKDDGVGMEQSYADQLLHSSNDTDADRRARVRPIGINNISDRLTYLFGDKHFFSIWSRPGMGTQITIQIPLVADPDVYFHGKSPTI